MSTPLLSVILPNYNHADYLPRALAAFAAQTFTDYEIVIVDDGSTDDSMAVIQEHARRDPRIRVYQNEQNRGVAYSLNRALSLARGKYVQGASSDDYVMPNYFAAAMAQFEAHPDAGLCVGLSECVRDSDGSSFLVPGYWAEEAGYLSPEMVAKRMHDCGVPGPAIWRREFFLQVGGYIPDLRWHCDWFTLQVIAFRHGICFLPERCSVVRMTDGSYSNGQHHRPIAQHRVLQLLLRTLLSDGNQDVVPLFIRSGILRQFGPDVVRAAITMTDPPAGLPALVKEFFFAHATALLTECADEEKRAAIDFLAKYGREGFAFYRLLGRATRDPNSEVAASAKAARTLIRKDTPLKTKLRYFAKRTIGTITWGLDRSIRPLYHYRLERYELLFEQLINLQQQMAGAMGGMSNELQQIRKELQAQAAKSTLVEVPKRKAA